MTTSAHKEDRVKKATPHSINAKIERDTWRRIVSYENKSDEDISARIKQLEKEWDIERYLGVNMSTIAISGLAAAALTGNKKWNLVPAVVLAFFFQHSVQGWCPPLPILRMLKIRTSKEIEEEKYALKILRGDFSQANGEAGTPDIENLKESVRRGSML